jgi:hypothetical protein
MCLQPVSKVDAATEIRDNSVNLRRATCAVHKRADKCIEAEGGILKMCCNLCKIELQKIKSTEINFFCDNKCIKMM